MVFGRNAEGIVVYLISEQQRRVAVVSATSDGAVPTRAQVATRNVAAAVDSDACRP
jgi:hypothetical protein